MKKRNKKSRRMTCGLTPLRTCAICMGIVFFAAACVSRPATVTLPMTLELMEEIKPENMDQVSYFLSKEMRLKRLDKGREGVKFENGIAIQVNKREKDTVLFKKEIPGIATANMLVQEDNKVFQVLGIEFEENLNYKLGFGLRTNNKNGRFEMLFDDDEWELIRYGGSLYQASYAGMERPYLLVKVAKDLVSDAFMRKASGRIIDGGKKSE